MEDIHRYQYVEGTPSRVGALDSQCLSRHHRGPDPHRTFSPLHVFLPHPQRKVFGRI